MGITVQLPQASSNSGSLTELYTPSPNLAKMSLSLYDAFQQKSSNSTKDLHLEFFDAKNNTMIKNVSFFINVTKGDKILIHDLFYTKTGSMTIKFHPRSDMGKWTVNGSLDPILGGWMSQNDTVSVTVPAFTEEGTYHIHFAVLALVYVNGLVDQSNPPTFDSWWLVDKKGNISKYDNSTSVSFGPSPHSVEIKDKSPLRQLKSGIASKDVKCVQGLQLVIKAEDNSPACVKHDTATKLITRGWSKVITSIENTNLNTLSENGCGQFYTAPGNQDNNKVPVLLMNSNSTGCTRLTFTIIYNYHNTPWPRIANFPPLGIVGNTNHVTHGDTFSVTPGKDFTNSFQIAIMPQTVDLANYPIGSNFTVTYVIKPLPNATGFYDHSIPKLACESYPLAVGYTANQVNYSDFSYIDLLNPPCGSGPYKLTAVEISGMNYKQVELGSHP